VTVWSDFPDAFAGAFMPATLPTTKSGAPTASRRRRRPGVAYVSQQSTSGTIDVSVQPLHFGNESIPVRKPEPFALHSEVELALLIFFGRSRMLGVLNGLQETILDFRYVRPSIRRNQDRVTHGPAVLLPAEGALHGLLNTGE